MQSSHSFPPVMQPELSLPELLEAHVEVAATGLVGCLLHRRLPDGALLSAAIVETEAYRGDEPGCHAYKGMTPRNSVMFGPPGSFYVYFTYGMWHCCNVVCEAEGTAAAVLLRAAAPLPPDDGSVAGRERLRLSGPGLLCRGMRIDRELNGASLLDSSGPVWLEKPAGWQKQSLARSTRIGFSFEDTLPWRFYLAGHPELSPGRPGAIRGKRSTRP